MVRTNPLDPVQKDWQGCRSLSREARYGRPAGGARSANNTRLSRPCPLALPLQRRSTCLSSTLRIFLGSKSCARPEDSLLCNDAERLVERQDGAAEGSRRRPLLLP